MSQEFRCRRATAVAAAVAALPPAPASRVAPAPRWVARCRCARRRRRRVKSDAASADAFGGGRDAAARSGAGNRGRRGRCAWRALALRRAAGARAGATDALLRRPRLLGRGVRHASANFLSTKPSKFYEVVAGFDARREELGPICRIRPSRDGCRVADAASRAPRRLGGRNSGAGGHRLRPPHLPAGAARGALRRAVLAAAEQGVGARERRGRRASRILLPPLQEPRRPRGARAAGGRARVARAAPRRPPRRTAAADRAGAARRSPTPRPTCCA